MTTILPPNSEICRNTSGQEYVLPPGSLHQGGCHVLMGDGAVKFITDSIEAGNARSPMVYDGGPIAARQQEPLWVVGVRSVRVHPGRSSMRTFSALIFLLCTVTLGVVAEADNRTPIRDSDLQEFLIENCWDCHRGEDAEAGFDIMSLSPDWHDAGSRVHWANVLRRVERAEMPPAEYGTLSPEHTQPVIDTIRRSLATADRQRQQESGRAPLRGDSAAWSLPTRCRTCLTCPTPTSPTCCRPMASNMGSRKVLARSTSPT